MVPFVSPIEKGNYAPEAKRYSGLKEAAYVEIKQRLLGNKILPGERIREDLIAEEMGISRTPVREAINQLVAEGLVVNLPRKGLFALEISVQEIEKMIEVRVVLETLAVRMCCQMITEEQIGDLEEIFRHYQVLLRSKDFTEASKVDSEIHNYIARVSDNKKLIDYIRDLEELFTYTRARNVRWTQEMVDGHIRLHRTLLDAIHRRDVSRAQKAMEADIRGMLSLLH